MSSHRLVLCLALLTASVGFAQVAPVVSPQDPEAAPAEAQPTPPPLPPPDPSLAQPPTPSEPPPPPPPGELIPYHYQPQPVPAPDLLLPRIMSEAFGGVLGGLGGGIVGLLVGASALESVDCSSGEEVCFATVLIVTIPAVFVGIPLGVEIAGEAMGGRGKFVPALLGTMVGTVAGFAYGSTQDGSGDLAAGLIIGPLLGAIVGYEISHAVNSYGPPEPRTASSKQGGIQLSPLAATTRNGGFVGGLAGRF